MKEKLLVLSFVVASLLALSPLAGAEGWECDADSGVKCTATLILANGTQVSVSMDRGQSLHRGEGVTVLLTSDNWDAIPA